MRMQRPNATKAAILARAPWPFRARDAERALARELRRQGDVGLPGVAQKIVRVHRRSARVPRRRSCMSTGIIGTSIERALEVLGNGGLVAIPTETV